MRFKRWLELGAWVLGVAALGLYAAARLSSERTRVAGVEQFREQHAESPVPEAVPTDTEGAMARTLQVDQSLWSKQRISAFAESAAASGAPQGVLRIPALELEVPVYSGATEINLDRGAAHIEGTAALSHVGNIGIAAHRDGFFRKLKDIAIDDEVGLDVGERTLRYRVVAISVVQPSDVQVLAPTEVPSITLVTCYPFYFLGTAPQRYIVRAELTGVPRTDRS
jgi:sortase A